MSGRDEQGRPPNDVRFVQVGIGLTIARSCGKCGKRSTQQLGSSRHRLYGYVGPCCTKPKETK